MGKSYTSSEIKTTRSSREQKQQRQRVGGIMVDKQRTPQSYNILVGLQKHNIPFDNGMTWNGAAKTLMGALDCGIIDMSMGYSPRGDQEESLDNENIMDDDLYGSLKPEPMSANDSFTDPADPFYQMGDDLPDNISAERQETERKNESSYITFASALQTESAHTLERIETLKKLAGLG